MRVPDSDDAALVLVEFQNIWTRPSLYHSLIRRQLERRGTIANAVQLVAAARAAGLPIVQAPLVVDPANKRGLFAKATMGLVFRKGSPGAELDPRVHADDDLVARGRTAFDAFVGSDLAEILSRLGRRALLFAGFVTDQCVAKTMISAKRQGYEAWLVSDACATFADTLHTRAERRFPDRAVTTSDVVQWLATSRAHGGDAR